MQKLFISDLHLSEDHPRLIQGFLSLLKHYQHQPTELYILGDWFNVWLADGDPSAWLLPIVKQLREFTASGNRIYFLCGNRDFVLGQGFLNRFDGILLQEPYFLDWQQQHIRIEHGDALCTDDIAYQKFKSVIRNPIILNFLKILPFYLKRKLADYFRRKSQQRQTQTHYQPIDVNFQEVDRQMQQINILIHGHTHRPAIHHLNEAQQRIVLGDWREDTGCAKIVLLENNGQINFFDWRF
ncbi:UDP-2,3-diacylglucosamine diphosphatase [Acinetobacter qingfengensis]|uniref:UDP-2,3-diacylglucosamine hydrolase n=1 Tax=Acinetobacter qingfengensis TaxID=1262585 RepID=A0A1E7QYX4_9GAMM|nr:UDP-2,3-diacylglucosamine diphosphatase [Acinetobacter qingfengensis]KAA8730970.1 UDP-2,3-diacylglucosamine diphosphatase [Acinetobacter qingfengensis]OEY92251.1 UDP-2,3-diacylglucosamine diphosphatase [Acinetobacter qingfengensis]